MNTNSELFQAGDIVRSIVSGSQRPMFVMVVDNPDYSLPHPDFFAGVVLMDLAKDEMQGKLADNWQREKFAKASWSELLAIARIIT